MSFYEYLEEQLILAATEPGMSRQNQLDARYARDFGLLAVRAIAGPEEEFNTALRAVGMAAAILLHSSKDPEVALHGTFVPNVIFGIAAIRKVTS